ncbi:MAG: nucleotide exchange factor GrpE [Bacteroidia bacterium]
MNTKEADEQETLNKSNQNTGELIINDAETEAERDNKEADEVISETDGVINLMKKVQEELETMKDKFLRLNAEFDNYRRRTVKERIDLIKTANSDVIVALLPVLDDLERAIKSLDKDENATALEGVNLIQNKFKSILDGKGLKAMESIGKPFDVELHDAITQVPAPSDNLKDTVMDEVERGYFLNDKVIRHAKVVVYN